MSPRRAVQYKVAMATAQREYNRAQQFYTFTAVLILKVDCCAVVPYDSSATDLGYDRRSLG